MASGCRTSSSGLRAGRYDREGRFPAENLVDLHKAGLFGVFIPPEFAAVARPLARGCGSTAMCWVMQDGQGQVPLEHDGG